MRVLILNSWILSLLCFSSIYAEVLRVDPSATGTGDGKTWANAYTSIHSALTASTSGDEVWVKAGIYKTTSSSDRSASFQLKSNVGLYGGFAGAESHRFERDWTVNHTTLSGDIATANVKFDNSYHVVTGASNAALDGFHVTAGQADGSSTLSYGAGLYTTANMEIKNCSFISNVASNKGGAIYINASSSSPIIEDSVFLLNKTTGSSANGGALYLGSNTPMVRSCQFIMNSATGDGGGVYLSTANTIPNILSSVFYSNTAANGAGLYSGASSHTYLAGSLFIGNTASSNGGAVNVAGSGQSSVEFCTFYNNNATTNGGPALYYTITLNIKNTIINTHTGVSAKAGVGGSGTITYSNIENMITSGVFDTNYGTDGGSNISSDPGFVSVSNFMGSDGVWATGDDGLMLGSSSPSLNTALTSTAWIFDVIGRTRPRGAAMDMGAYEGSAGLDPVLSFSTAHKSVTESAGTDTLTVTRSGSSTASVSVSLLTHGSAIKGSDYTLAAETITFAAGETSKTISVTVKDDVVTESQESLHIELSTPIGAVVGHKKFGNLSIVDNDTLATPTVFLGASNYSDFETSTSFTLPVFLSHVQNTAVTVNYTLTGTATQGSDYSNSSSGTITFAAGEVKKNVTLSIINDQSLESTETVILTISGPSGANLGPQTVFTYSILDNDQAPVVEFDSAVYSHTEGSSSSITIRVSTPVDQALTVSYSTNGGTATQGTDYSSFSGNATISAGGSSTTVLLSSTQDTTAESDETIVLVLSNPSSGTIGTCNTSTLTIKDNDQIPSVSFFLSNGSVQETDTSASISLSLSHAYTQNVTVNYAVTGGTATNNSDYVLASGTATITAGFTFASISVQLNDDLVDEVNETIEVSLSSPVSATLGSISKHTITIFDNDPSSGYQVQFSSASSKNIESISFSPQATVRLYNNNFLTPANREITVAYAVTGGTATSGTDFSATSGTLTISTGSSSNSISLPFINDTALEPDETVILTLSNPNGASLGTISSHTFTIEDDETPPTVSFSSSVQSVNEYDSSTTLYVNPSRKFSSSFTVNYSVTSGTATSGTDYTLASGTLTFPASSIASQSISLSIIDDLSVESSETVIVTLSSPSAGVSLGTRSSATVTILDNDSTPTLSFGSGGTYSENQSANISLNLTHKSSQDIYVDYKVTGGTAVIGTDYSTSNGMVKIPKGSLSASFSLSLVNDFLPESTETMIITLSNPSGAQFASSATSLTKTFTIHDNDATPTVSFNRSQDQILEGQNFSPRVQLSHVVDFDVYVYYSLSGTASDCGIDYPLHNNQRVKISSGSTSVTLGSSLTITDDLISETLETAVITLYNPINANLGSQKTYTLTIEDNDSTPTLLHPPFMLAVEGQSSSVSIPFHISYTTTGSITVDYTLQGSATAGQDYTLSSGTITILPNASSTSLSIPILNDSIQEGTEKLILAFSNPSNVLLGSPNSVEVIIMDDETSRIFSKDSVANFSQVQTFGGNNSDDADALASDKFGNLYLAGSFSGNVDFDPGTGTKIIQSSGSSTGASSLYISKFNTSGAYVETFTFHGTGLRLETIKIDSNLNLYMLGRFSGQFDADPSSTGQTLLTSNGVDDIYIIKLNSQGQLVWAKSIGGTAADEGSTLAISPDDNYIYFGGTFRNTVDFDPSSSSTANLTSHSTGKSGFIAKWNSNGQHVWVRSYTQIGTNSTFLEEVSHLSVDANQDIYVVGSFDVELDFNVSGSTPRAIVPKGSSDAFLHKLNSNGEHQWVRTFGGSGTDEGLGIRLSPDGKLVIAYLFSTMIDVRPDSAVDLRYAGGTSKDAVMSKIDKNGNFEWAQVMHFSGSADLGDLRIDSQGEIYVCGEFSGAVAVNGINDIRRSTGASYSDAFISRYTKDGVHVWTKTLGGDQYDSAENIHITASRGVVVSGDFYKTVDFDPGSGVTAKTSNGFNDVFLMHLTQIFPNDSGDLVFKKTPNVVLGGKTRILVQGGTPPYQFSVGASPVVRIVQGHLLEGIQIGSFTLTVSDASGKSNSIQAQVLTAKRRAHQTSLPSFNSPNDYRMVTFPYYHKGRGAAFLIERLQSHFGGPMHEENYLVFAYTGRGGDGYELLGTPNIVPEIGRAYWMASVGGRSFSIEADAPTVDETIQVTLQQGWNMIGNPYGQAISVNDLYISHGTQFINVRNSEQRITGKLFWVFVPNVGYQNVDVLNVGQAVWFYVFETTNVDLIFDYNASTKLKATHFKSDTSEPSPPSPPGFAGSSGGAGIGSASGGGGCFLLPTSRSK